jgi:hypothetical protein
VHIFVFFQPAPAQEYNDERNFRILSMAQIARHIQAFWKSTEE